MVLKFQMHTEEFLLLIKNTGTTLQCGLDIYASEAAFTANAQPFNMPELAYVEVAYNRDADGVDVLDLAHDAQMTKLSSVGISTTKVLGE